MLLRHIVVMYSYAKQGNNIQVFQNKTPNFGDASIGFVQRKVAFSS